jgi:1-acyl-sn-glycerol-3-phosphate acyltransferase
MFSALRMLFVFVSLGVPAALIGMSWTLLRGNFRLMYRFGMGIMRLGVRAGGIHVRIEGLENVPSGESCLFLSNHVSNLDPPVLLPAIPGMTSVFLKQSLMKIPLLGTAMRMGKFIPVSRGHQREDAQKSVEFATQVLRSGLHITIFPEGTRSPDGKLLPFKKGAFFLAEATGAPIVPIVIEGTAKMMRRGSLKVYPCASGGVVVVKFLAAIRPQEFATRDAMMDAVRARMEAALSLAIG